MVVQDVKAPGWARETRVDLQLILIVPASLSPAIDNHALHLNVGRALWAVKHSAPSFSRMLYADLQDDSTGQCG